MTIEVGKTGRIVAGDGLGTFVRVIDDAQSTGGYLILTSDESNFLEGFDSWVEDAAALERFFHEAGWIVAWESK